LVGGGHSGGAEGAGVAVDDVAALENEEEEDGKTELIEWLECITGVILSLGRG